MCFASPFDVADEDEKEVNNSIENTSIQPRAVNTSEDSQDIIQPKIEQIQFLVESNSAKIATIDIKTGNNNLFEVPVGGSIKVEDINLRLKNCLIEGDNFYHKISVAELSVDGNHMIISNDSNLGNTPIKDLLLVVNCNHK
jgi:hypothetical protein